MKTFAPNLKPSFSAHTAPARKPSRSLLGSRRNSLADLTRPLVQPKLVVGQAGDEYEQEADRVAAEVAQTSASKNSNEQGGIAPKGGLLIQRVFPREPTPLQRQPDNDEDEQEEKREEEDEEEKRIQKKGLPGQSPRLTPKIFQRLKAVFDRGRPLPDAEREYFETRFGHDFSKVRVHDDPESAEIAHDLHAQAFTHGHNIFFESGQYRPDTSQGKFLIAHELTHVVQQRTQEAPIAREPNESQYKLSWKDEPLERAAEQTANAVTMGSSAIDFFRPPSLHSAHNVIARRTVNQAGDLATHPEPIENVDAISARVLFGLQRDPQDSSGQVKEQLAVLVPSTREVVVDQVQSLMTPEQRSKAQPAFTKPDPTKSEEASPKPATPSARSEEPTEQTSSAVTEPSFPASTEAQAEAFRNLRTAAVKAKASSEPEFKQDIDLKSAPADTQTETTAAKLPNAVAAQNKEESEIASAKEELNKIKLPEEAHKVEGDTEAPPEAGEEGEAATEAEGASGASATEAGATGPGAAQEASTPAATLDALASARVSFLPSEDEDVGDPGTLLAVQNRRFAVENLATGFLARSVSVIREILGFGENIPERLQSSADAAKTDIDATTANNSAEVAAHIGEIRAQAKSTAATTRARTKRVNQTTLAKNQQATKLAKATSQKAHQTAITELDKHTKNQKDRINILYANGDRDFRAVGPKVGGEALSIGRNRKNDYLSQRNGESDFFDGPLHDNRLEAKADAATKVAEEYDKGLREEANTQAEKGQKGKPKDLEQIEKAAQESRKALDTQFKAADEGQTQVETQALTTANRTLAQMQQTVATTQSATLDSLAEQEEVQVARLEQYGQRQKGAIDRDTGSAINSLQQSTYTAAGTLANRLQEFMTNAQGFETPDQESLSEFLEGSEAEIGRTSQTSQQQIGQSLNLTDQSIIAGGAQSVNALNQLGQSAQEQATATETPFTEGLGQMDKGAQTGYANMAKAHAKTSKTTADTAVKGFENVTTGIKTFFSTADKNLEAGFKESAKGIETGLKDAMKGNGQKGLEPDINKHAQEAADKVQPRWKSVLKVLLVIAVIIVVAVLVGPAVIGLVGGAATALGAGAAAGAIGIIVGGAIVGAAAGAVIQVGNNVIDGKRGLEVFEGVGKAAAIGAIGGAFGGLGSVAGKFLTAGITNAIGQVGLRIGIQGTLDVIGGIVGDLVVKGTVDWSSVLIGAGIGAAVGLSSLKLSNLGKFGGLAQKIKLGKLGSLAGKLKLGKIAGFAGKIQDKSSRFGERVGKAVGGGIKTLGGKIGGALGIKPKVSPPPTEIPASKPLEGGAKPAEAEAKPAEAEAKAPEAEAKPIEAEAKPTETEAKPAEAEAKPVEAEAKPTEAEAKPVEAEAKPTEAEAKPIEAEAKPTEAETKPAEAEAKPAEAEARPAKAGVEPAEAEAKPAKAGAEPAEAEAKRAEAEALADAKAKVKAKEKIDALGKQKELNEKEIERLKNEIKKKKAKLEKIEKQKDSARTSQEKEAKRQQANRRSRDIANKEDEIGALESKNRGINKEVRRQEFILKPNEKVALPCFSGDTLVWTIDGPKRIDSLNEGEKAFAFDFKLNQTTIRRINKVFSNRTKHFYEISNGGNRIYATGRHPFWVQERSEWIEAKALTRGMRLRLLNGDAILIDSIKLIENIESKSYNLGIEETPNYFVGIGALVHNEGLPPYEFGDHVLYEAINRDFPDKVYIGRTNDLAIRQGQHISKALRELANPSKLTAEQKAFYEFMKGAKLRPRATGLNENQAKYLEQRNIDIELELRGDNLVNQKLVEVSKDNMKALADEIINDPKVKEAGFCPR